MFRFPWGDMHSLNLGWFLQKFNELREDWATAEAGIDGALDAEIEKAEDALSDVFAARDAAAASATAAAGSASSAGTSATAAGNSATAAASSATLANQKATAAGLSEAAAAQSATAAGNSATNAAGSATAAGQSATNAAGSATAAGQSATNAAGSATAAGNSATAAAGSASDAADSARAAAQAAASIPSDYENLANTVVEITEKVYYDDTVSGTSVAEIPISIPAGSYYIALDGIVSADPVQNKSAISFRDANNSIIAFFSLPRGTPLYKQLILPSPITTMVCYASTGYGESSGYTFTFNNIKIYREGTENPYNIIAPEIPLLIADTNLGPNDFRIVNGKLYKITTNVVADTQLIPNTNCIETQICTVLKSIL